MSLLEELEELQRCLEGTADSDSEELSKPAVPTINSKISGEEVEPSHTSKNRSEPIVLVQDSASECLSLAGVVDKQSVCKTSRVQAEKASTDTTCVKTDKLSVDLGQSALNSDKVESPAHVSKPGMSSHVSGTDKRFTSDNSGQELETGDARIVSVKNVSPGSGMPLANVNNDSADVNISEAKTHIEKDSLNENLKTSPSKKDELELLSSNPDKMKTSSLKQEEVKRITCKEGEQKVPDTSAVNRDFFNTVSLSTDVSKMRRGSQISETESLPVVSPALTNEKRLSLMKMKPEDAKNADSSTKVRIIEEASLYLQSEANKPVTASKQVQTLTSSSTLPDKCKVEEVRLPSMTVNMPASDSGLVAGSKTEIESTSLQQTSCTTLKASKPCLNSTLGRKYSLDSDHGPEHRNDSETTNTPVFGVDSKMSRLEEVKISNGRPVIRILKVSPDSSKNKLEMAGVSASSPSSLLIVRRGGVPKEGGCANSSPGVVKREISFGIGSASGHVLGKKHPTPSIDTSKHMKSREMKTNYAGPKSKKRKLSTDAEPLSVNTATSQQVPEDKFSFTSVEILKMGHEKLVAPKTSEPAEQKLCDVSVKEEVPVDSESMFIDNASSNQDTRGRYAQDLCLKLGLEEGIFLKASGPVAMKRALGTPLVRKRRVSSDPVAFDSVALSASRGDDLLVSEGKRRKISASHAGYLAEETLNSEFMVQNAGTVKVARSPTTKRVPITSAMEVTISPHGVEQNMQMLPVNKLEEYNVDSDLAVEKEDSKKELMEARVVLKKLNIPVPEYLLSLPVQNEKTMKTKPQSLQKTLEKVSMMLQETLTGSSPLKKRNVGKPKKLQDDVVEPIKRQKVVKRPVMQQKIMEKLAKQRSMGKQAQQNIMKKSQQKIMGKPKQKFAGKSLQHKCMEKPEQQKVKGKPLQQKLAGRPKQQKKTVQQQKTVTKPKTIQRTSSANLPSITVRIGKKKNKVIPKKVVSSKNRTKSQKVVQSVIAKKTTKQMAIGNLKYKQSAKSASNHRPEVRKKIVKEKKITLNESKQNKFDWKEKTTPKNNTKATSLVRVKEVVPPAMKIKQPPMKAVKTFQHKNPVPTKKLSELKKVFTVDERMKKLQETPVEPSKPVGGDTAADDEWIVEVLLEDSEMDMMTVSSQMEVSQDANMSRVSSSDDKPKELCVSTSDLDANHSLECDSSTDTNRNGKTVLSGGKHMRRTSNASKSCTGRTLLSANAKQRVALPSVKQVTSSVNVDERTGISAEQKMAEMRKAIGDLERIADRSMLRLKAEERQVMYLSRKLRDYENDKHHKMLRKILRDAAPGPKQNHDAMFILDLLLSYCPEEDDTLSS